MATTALFGRNHCVYPEHIKTLSTVIYLCIIFLFKTLFFENLTPGTSSSIMVITYKMLIMHRIKFFAASMISD